MIPKLNNKFEREGTELAKQQNSLKRCVIENSCDSLDLSTIPKYRVTDCKGSDAKKNSNHLRNINSTLHHKDNTT